jgi:hypothetical protein
MFIQKVSAASMNSMLNQSVYQVKHGRFAVLQLWYQKRNWQVCERTKTWEVCLYNVCACNTLCMSPHLPVTGFWSKKKIQFEIKIGTSEQFKSLIAQPLSFKKALWVSAGKAYWRGRLSTVDLLALTSLYKVLLLLKILFILFYKTS